MILRPPCSDIGAIYGAWRGACDRREIVGAVDVVQRSGVDAPCEWLSQARQRFEETDMAIDNGKKNKTLGPDESENGQMQSLEVEQRRRVYAAHSEIFDEGSEPDEGQQWFVVPLDKSSAKDPYELLQKRLVSLSSQGGKTY